MVMHMLISCQSPQTVFVPVDIPLHPVEKKEKNQKKELLSLIRLSTVIPGWNCPANSYPPRPPAIQTDICTMTMDEPMMHPNSETFV